MDILTPKPFPFDYEDWKKRPFNERAKMLCQAWAVQGYGAPLSAYLFYVLKIGLFIWLWFVFTSFSTELGGWRDVGSWWFKPDALLRAILWSMVFEGLGMASGSGPLTARYLPPFGGVFYFLRPGTIKMPYLPQIPVLGGYKRTWVDVILYLAFIVSIFRALIAPTIDASLLIPIVVLLPILACLDRTIFLSARGEHYFIATLCFLFPEQIIPGTKVVWWGVWFWAATSKLNRHFPSVIGVMVSNSGVLRFPGLRKALYKNYPDDLRPGPLATNLAHFGTAVEYTFPLILIFSDGGTLTLIGLIVMLGFHTFITANVPMAVPLEWNFTMVYGGFVLFGHHAGTSLFSLSDPLLAGLIITAVVILPVIGNLYPAWVSFLISMRYYAGNWAYGVWLFKGDSEEKLNQHLTKPASTIPHQLNRFYSEQTIDSLLEMVIGFRMMHLHGRVLHDLIPKAVDNIEEYVWRDGELVCGVVLGWNFGDGHLHREPLLEAVQSDCNFESGELRCIFVESQPFGKPYHEWRIVDAKDGLIESGRTQIDDIINNQPWPTLVNKKDLEKTG
ncbi:MAG: DUF3556 domain-containing protein [Chloroflexota bacterium]